MKHNLFAQRPNVDMFWRDPATFTGNEVNQHIHPTKNNWFRDQWVEGLRWFPPYRAVIYLNWTRGKPLQTSPKALYHADTHPRIHYIRWSKRINHNQPVGWTKHETPPSCSKTKLDPGQFLYLFLIIANGFVPNHVLLQYVVTSWIWMLFLSRHINM